MSKMLIPEELFSLLVCPQDRESLFYVNVQQRTQNTGTSEAGAEVSGGGASGGGGISGGIRGGGDSEIHGDLISVTGTDFLYNPRLDVAYKLNDGIAELLVDTCVEVEPNIAKHLKDLISKDQLQSSQPVR